MDDTKDVSIDNDASLPEQAPAVDDTKLNDTLTTAENALIVEDETTHVNPQSDEVKTKEPIKEAFMDKEEPNSNAAPAQQQQQDPPSLVDSDDMEDDDEDNKPAPILALEEEEDDDDDEERHNSDGEDDVASKAAVALAAVAAAANANHKSPAEAAREARLVAQSFITASSDAPRDKTPKMVTVGLSVVKEHLRQRTLENGSVLMNTLCRGENDALLQLLLLLERVRCIDDSHEEVVKRDERAAAIACDRMLALVKKIEGAYESMINMLPSTSRREVIDEDDYETPVVVPDLLPPCTTPNGDPTLAFFRACVGEHAVHEATTDATPSTVSETTAGASKDSMESQPRPSSSHTSSPARHGSFLGAMFKRNNSGGTSAPKSLTNVFRKKSLRGSQSMDDSASTHSEKSDDNADTVHPGEYPVKIEREMLGLTVENVLERTVVRTVLPGGPAKKAGAKVGSLIVKVGNVETRNLTHFETIDELRQSQRPLMLVMKQVSEDSLRSAREEMGRLIRGSGFGTIMDGNGRAGEDEMEGGEDGRPLIGADLRIDAFTNLLRRRFAEATPVAKNKKEESVARAGEKLVWILTLFTIGLEREAARLMSLAGNNDATVSPKRRSSYFSHTSKDYADAAKSVSKVLLDFTRKRIDPQDSPQRSRTAGFLQHSLEAVGGVRRRNKGPQPPPPPVVGRGGRGPLTPGGNDEVVAHEKPLLQVGDVLKRTSTFLADTTSPPAALLRGELIAFLCDVLDIDTEMELAEEESDSAVAGSSGGAKPGLITDLGSAGSLLKLIVLNCPIMRSPGCEEASARREKLDSDVEEELRKRFGPREKFTASDVHRLHAGNRFLSVVHRLAASRSTSARITACSLGPVLWGHLDFPHQLQLRGVITRALHDVEVTVRKSTATVLHEIAELVFDRRSVPWLVLMCERAMTDPEPQLRSAAMTLTWHLAEHLPNAFLGNASQGSRYLRRLPNREDPIFADVYLLQCKLLPVATRLAEDRSPSVRLAVAAQCDRLCDALGDHWSSVIIDVLLALLSDSDDRVRCEAVSCVPRLAEIVLLSVAPGEVAVSEVSILEALVPASIKLQKDSSPSVRVALAAAAGELLTLLVAMQSRSDEAAHADPTSPDKAPAPDAHKKYKLQIDERLIPLVQNLLNDKDPEVTSAALRAVTNATRSSVHQSRNRLMSVTSTDDDAASLSSFQSHASENKAPVITPVLSEKQVLRLLPTLTELAGSRQWRVRQSAVEIVPALLGCTQKLETRSEISKLCISLMSDKVDAVRKTAAECLCMGGSSLGSHGEDASAEWIASIVIPTIRKCAVQADSKQRLLSLKMVEVVLQNGVCPTKWKTDSTDEDRMADSPMRELALIALSLTMDRIANVRLNVGRVLEGVIHVFEEDDLSYIKEVLLQQIDSEKERLGGGDQDVLFFAERCVTRARNLLEDKSVNEDGSTLLEV